MFSLLSHLFWGTLGTPIYGNVISWPSGSSPGHEQTPTEVRITRATTTRQENQKFCPWQGSDRLASDATWTLKATGDETKSASARRCTELVLDMSILSMSLGTRGPSEINSRNVLGFAGGMHDERTSTCGLVGVLWFLLKSQDRIRTIQKLECTTQASLLFWHWFLSESPEGLNPPVSPNENAAPCGVFSPWLRRSFKKTQYYMTRDVQLLNRFQGLVPIVAAHCSHTKMKRGSDILIFVRKHPSFKTAITNRTMMSEPWVQKNGVYTAVHAPRAEQNQWIQATTELLADRQTTFWAFNNMNK